MRAWILVSMASLHLMHFQCRIVRAPLFRQGLTFCRTLSAPACRWVELNRVRIRLYDTLLELSDGGLTPRCHVAIITHNTRSSPPPSLSLCLRFVWSGGFIKVRLTLFTYLNRICEIVQHHRHKKLKWTNKIKVLRLNVNNIADDVTSDGILFHAYSDRDTLGADSSFSWT